MSEEEKIIKEGTEDIDKDVKNKGSRKEIFNKCKALYDKYPKNIEGNFLT
jgi:hypothetical protein